jgi:hypothetical protein
MRKLRAATLHNLRVGSILIGIVPPLVHGEPARALTIVGWLAAGAFWTGAAQLLVGRLP